MRKIIGCVIGMVVAFLIAGGLAAGYAFFIEPGRLAVKNHYLEKQTEGEDTVVTAVQISDIHVSRYFGDSRLERLVERVNEQNADFILFTGDLFDNYAQYHPADAVTARLLAMKARYGKFAVWGNRDYGGGAFRVYESLMEEAGFTVLTNESVSVELDSGKRIFIGGIDDFLLGKPDINGTAAEIAGEDYVIMAMHEPDRSEELAGRKVDLVLAGHSHGGQVRIPFIKLITTRLAEKYIRGFYRIGKGTQVFVNTGIGTTRIPARFLVPPEIDVFHIRL